MGLEELRAEILRNAAAEAKRIEREGEAGEKRVLEEADAYRKSLLERSRAAAEAVIRAERNERLSSVRLSGRKMVAAARDAALRAAVEEARARFLSLPESSPKAYAELLDGIIRAGVAEAGKGAVVHLNARDMKRAKRVTGAKVAGEPEGFAGGALVESADGKILVRGTLEDIFEENSGSVRAFLNASMFGAGGK